VGCEVAAIENRILGSATLLATSMYPYLDREIRGASGILGDPDVEVEAMIARQLQWHDMMESDRYQSSVSFIPCSVNSRPPN
jgi:hypothetical protein